MSLFSRKPTQAELPRRRRAATEASKGSRRDVAAERQQDANSTFKRNRTLTGSASPHVSTVSEPTADLQSPRTHAHHLARKRRKVGSLFVAVTTAGFVVALLLYEFTASPVVSSSDSSLSIDKDRYATVIDEYLGRQPVERLRFALNNTRLTEYLQRQLPEVADVREDGPSGFGVTRFTVMVRQPIAGWLIGDRQYFVDARGVPFEKNYFQSPTVSVVDDSGIQQASGTAIASGRFLTFVGRAVSLSAENGMVVEQAIIPFGTTRQLELKIAGQNFPIKLSLDRPVGEQVEDMRRAVVWFEQRNQKPEYIDVRVSGKAFYR